MLIMRIGSVSNDIYLFAKSTACLAKTFFDWFARRKSGKW